MNAWGWVLVIWFGFASLFGARTSTEAEKRGLYNAKYPKWFISGWLLLGAVVAVAVIPFFAAWEIWKIIRRK